MGALPLFPQGGGPEYAATKAVRDYCGWHVAPSFTEDAILDGSGTRRLYLPTKHLTNVSKLAVEGRLVENFTFSTNGWLSLSCGIFPKKDRCVEITFTHGFDDAEAVASVVRAIAARARMSPTGNIVQQRAGTQSVTYASAGGQVIGFGLLQAEKELLQPYRLDGGVY